MKVNAIVAIGEQNQMALNNQLPWHYPEDLKFFKEKVKGKIVILGRKTYESMPKSFFKTVTAIIVSQTLEINEYLAHSLEEALCIAEDIGDSEVWLLGGASIYEEAIKNDLINQLHVSHIPYDGPADIFFPHFTHKIWGVSDGQTIYSEINNKSFRYKCYDLQEEIEVPFIPFSQTFQSSQSQFLDSISSTDIRWTSGPGSQPGDMWIDDDNVIRTMANGEVVAIGDFDFPSESPSIHTNVVDFIERALRRYETCIRDEELMVFIRDHFLTLARQDDPNNTLVIQTILRSEARRIPLYVPGSAIAEYVPGHSETAIDFFVTGNFRGTDIYIEYTAR